MKKNYFQFRFSFILVINFFLLSFTPLLPAQERSEITGGSPYLLYSEVEQSMMTLLPNLQEELKTVLKNLKDPKNLPSLNLVKAQILSLEILLKKTQLNTNFSQVSSSLDEIRASVSKAESFLQQKQIEPARKALQRSMVYSKVLLQSPMLKMTQAEIDLDEASLRISNKDYTAAGLFLEKSLDHLKGLLIQDNPRLASQMNSIKSDITLLQQQIILGKAKDDQQSRAIWKRMKQAQVDSLSHYYSVWSNTYDPLVGDY